MQLSKHICPIGITSPGSMVAQAAYICMHCAGLFLVLELQTLLCMEVQSEPSYKAGLSEALWR